MNRPSTRVRHFFTYLAITILTVTACSSTTRQATSPDGSPSPGVSPTDSGTPTVGPSGLSKTPGGGSAKPGPKSLGPGGVQPSTKFPLKGKGYNEKEVRIGFWFLVKGNACQTLGASGQCGTGDDDTELNALVKWVNSNGGMGGRKLVPKVYRTDVTSSNWAAQAQAACTYFTEDQDLIMAVSEGEAGRPFGSNCIASKGLPVIDPAHWTWDAVERKKVLPLWYQPQRAAPEDWVPAWIDGLWNQGFFSNSSRIGLLRFDAGPYDRVTENIIKPRLAAHGLKLAPNGEAIITTPPSVAGYGQLNQQIASAILRFKGPPAIDRLLVFETMSEISLFFFPQARTQGFYPRLGVNSFQYPYSIQGVATPAQLAGAVGIGWQPYYDVAPEQDPGDSARAALCKQALQQGGAPPGAGRNPKCETIFFLKRVLDRAAVDFGMTPAGIRTAAESLGTSLPSAAGFATRFGPGDHQGLAAYRYLVYDNKECSCFKYMGGNHPF
ncbi:MAG: hypothetical protein WEB06_21490 [Actinomycetota bacterium]